MSGTALNDQDTDSKPIVLRNVNHFAYGVHQDGEVGVWAAGKAGWFALQPAKKYKKIYKDMMEAIDAYYFLSDRHNKAKGKKARILTSSYIFDEVMRYGLRST